MTPSRFILTMGKERGPSQEEEEKMSNLLSDLFRGDPRLENCLLYDSAHVLKGDRGDFVSKIQYAVLVLAGGKIRGSEVSGKVYGEDTARLVKKYKVDRRIINYTYQQSADDIVGKMTIRALDSEMLAIELHQRLRTYRA